jgi:hypothetical protein
VLAAFDTARLGCAECGVAQHCCRRDFTAQETEFLCLLSRDAVIVERDMAILHRDAVVEERDILLGERDAAILHRDAMVEEREALIFER